MASLFLILCTAGTVPGQAAAAGHTLFGNPGELSYYTLSYRDDTTTTLFPERAGSSVEKAATFMSSVDFQGTLGVLNCGMDGDVVVIQLTVADARRHRFALNGHDLFEDSRRFAKDFIGYPVIVRVNSANEILSWSFPRQTAQVFKQFLTTLTQDIQFSFYPGREHWSCQETHPYGTAEASYTLEPVGRNIQIRRHITRYDNPGLIDPGDVQSVDAVTTALLGEDGTLRSLKAYETVSILTADRSRTVLAVKKSLFLDQIEKRTQGSRCRTEEHDSMVTVFPGDAIPDDAVTRQELEKRIGSLRFDTILDWIRDFTPDPDDNRTHNALFHRTVGFIRLHPDTAPKLADAARKNTVSRQRVLIMNLLAAAGTPEAQDAMRSILADDEVARDPQYGILIQNFSFMDTLPENRTLLFLEELMTTGGGYVSHAAAYAMGALIHNLYLGHRRDKALELNRLLTERLKQQGSVPNVKECIGALGNAGIPDNNPLLFTYMESREPALRMEAAMALRKTETPEARNRLVTLLEDPVRAVQRSAIQTLTHFSPSEADFSVVRDRIADGTVQEANYYDLVSFLKKNMNRFPDGINDCLKLMIRNPLKDPDLEARIRKLLHR